MFIYPSTATSRVMLGYIRISGDTAETVQRLQDLPNFAADNPEITTTPPLVCYHPYTAEVDSIPLPSAAYQTRVSADKNYSIVALQYHQLTEDIKKRVRAAKEQITRNKGMTKYDKPGCKGSIVMTKRPSPSKRVILEWSEVPRALVGEWAIRYNNMVGCLIKRADFINHFLKFHQQPFKSIEDIWRKLMKLEERSPKNVLCKNSGGLGKILEAGPRVDFDHFAALLIYWDSSKSKGHQVMPVNLLVQEAYTPKAGYDKTERVEKIMKMQEIMDVTVSQKLQESQPEMDLHALSRKQNDQIIEGLFGPPRNGRCRFRGSGSRASTDTSTTFKPMRPSMPSTMQQPYESQEVLKLRSRVIAMLSGRLDPTVFAGIMPLIFGDIRTPRLTNAIAHIVHSLHGKIPDDIYVDVITSITATHDSSNDCAQPREGAGSTSARPAKEDAVDLGVHDGGEE